MTGAEYFCIGVGIASVLVAMIAVIVFLVSISAVIKSK